MRATFSEFSYGFCLTHELIAHYRRFQIPAPMFPSLVREGKEGGGYDVRIDVRGIPLFIQFKLSEHMERRSAAEWHLFNRQYFRFELRALRHSQQHRLLLNLESDRRNIVLYAAPMFYTDGELNEALLTRQMISRTVFVKPSAIGPLPDDQQHHIAFLPHTRYGYLCSEPKDISLFASGTEFIDQITANASETETQRINDTYFDELANKMIMILSELQDFSRDTAYSQISDLPPATRVSYLSRTFFGSEFFIVTPQ